jgi:hypothetical protein
MKLAGMFFFLMISTATSFAQLGSLKLSAQATNWNDHIDNVSRNQIKLLDDKVIASFYEGSAQKLTSMFSDKLKAAAGNKTDDLIKMVHPLVTTKDYTLLDEYLTKSPTIGGTTSVLKGVSGDEDYQVNFEIMAKQTYVSLIIYKTPLKDLLVTCIYGKNDDGWKINILRVGVYKILGKSAFDFYKQAKVRYEGGNLIDAWNNLCMAKQTAVPAENYFVYFKLPEMESFGNKVDAELRDKFPLPMTIREIKTLPQILVEEQAVINEGMFPSVSYLTKIDLKDVKALTAENDEIKKVIGKIFPGIEKNKKYVFFKAFNEIPNGKTPVEHFGFALNIPQ